MSQKKRHSVVISIIYACCLIAACRTSKHPENTNICDGCIIAVGDGQVHQIGTGYCNAIQIKNEGPGIIYFGDYLLTVSNGYAIAPKGIWFAPPTASLYDSSKMYWNIPETHPATVGIFRCVK